MRYHLWLRITLVRPDIVSQMVRSLQSRRSDCDCVLLDIIISFRRPPSTGSELFAYGSVLSVGTR